MTALPESAQERQSALPHTHPWLHQWAPPPGLDVPCAPPPRRAALQAQGRRLLEGLAVQPGIDRRQIFVGGVPTRVLAESSFVTEAWDRPW
jgi:hypothetical protein